MPNLTQTEANYLKRIYVNSFEKNWRVTSVSLAEELGVKAPSVVDMLKKLERKGLIIRIRWSEVRLTDEGIKVVRKLLYNHRILELYFSKVLGMDADESCREASKIDALIGDEVIIRLCDLLGRPDRCPHGFPIYEVS
ncbi:MAG: metal-dependent transcriptional regulator [Thaumarchaeota archaeon]|nr:metal-dependent transcriptional regulator [Nitrososphaerota archaeon]